MANETIRDFYLECKMYEHSQECFDLMKECAELQLQEKYLENAAFTLLNEEAITAAGAQQYFEAANAESNETKDEKVNKLSTKLNKFKENVGKILNKIFTGIKNLGAKFVKFLKKIFGVFKSGENIVNEIIKTINEHPITDREIEILAQSLATEKNFNVADFEQPKIKGLKFKIKDGKTKNRLAAALSSSYVNIAPIAIDEYTDVDLRNGKLETFKMLVMLMNASINLMEQKHLTSSSFKLGFVDGYRTSNIYYYKGYLKLDVNSQTIQKQIDTLQDLMTRMTNVNISEKIPAEQVTQFNKMLSHAMSLTSVYISMMNGFIAWRKESCQKLLEAAKHLPTKEETDAGYSNQEFTSESVSADYENIEAFLYGC